MKRLLPLVLFLGFAANALPALAEEVKVLLDLPAPGAEETRWFPGGRFLVVADWFDAQRDPPGTVNTFRNDLRFAVVDLETGNWRPAVPVDSKDELGDRPRTCLGSHDCMVLVSASGRFVKVERDDPGCSAARARSVSEKAIGGSTVFELLWPPTLSVSSLGSLLLFRCEGYPPDTDGHRGYDYFNAWVVQTPNAPDAWFEVLGWQRWNNENYPIVWTIPEDRSIVSGGWTYDSPLIPDRLALITADRRDPDDRATWRLLVVEVRP